MQMYRKKPAMSDTNPIAVLMRNNDSAIGGVSFVRYLYEGERVDSSHYNTRATGLFVWSTEQHSSWYDKEIAPHYEE